jgi:hydroxyacylglutathione hydrolase
MTDHMPRTYTELLRDARAQVPEISAVETDHLRTATPADAAPTIVDVREASEWEQGHVPGAVHLYVPDIAHHAAEIPRDAPVAVHCASGYRAGIAASLLEQAGLKRIIHVNGPYSDWDRLHLAESRP